MAIRVFTISRQCFDCLDQAMRSNPAVHCSTVSDQYSGEDITFTPRADRIDVEGLGAVTYLTNAKARRNRRQGGYYFICDGNTAVSAGRLGNAIKEYAGLLLDQQT